jgi:putative transposase
MSRPLRFIGPGEPHHIIIRGTRRMKIFLQENDYRTFGRLLATAFQRFSIEIWAYCLMPNHVHLIAVPKHGDSLSLAMGDAQRRYSIFINAREGWQGHLFQSRFASYPMDESHLFHAARYVELNPVKAGMVEKAEDYLWSSAKAHLTLKDDGLVSVGPLLRKYPLWSDYLAGGEGIEEKIIERHFRAGLPVGTEAYLKSWENRLGHPLITQKPGRKMNANARPGQKETSRQLPVPIFE